MEFLQVRAFLGLLLFEAYLRRKNFVALYKKVRECPIGQKARGLADPTERVCHAIDMACIWYPRQVLCLQRSAATTWLLRKCGVPAKMILAAKQMPFQAHAWVEVDGRVVNDKPYVPEIYAVLDRC